MMLLFFFYALSLLALTIYSYGFVDPNLALSTHPIYTKFHQPLYELVYRNRPLSTIIFLLFTFLLFIFYFLFLWLLKKNKLGRPQVRLLIGLAIGILFLSYPAFSYDIFNYIFTAKVAFLYKENPYLVMPISFINDPNLDFTRAANKVALYGPWWILLTLVPHVVGFGNIVLTVFSFKLIVVLFYILTCWLIWKMSKNIFSLTLFALNPLVIIETLVSGHNDIVMMFFALLAFYFLQQNKVVPSWISLAVSILIKYATLALLPVIIFFSFRTATNKNFDWSKIYTISALLMFFAFFTSPIREEFYSWYAIWMLSFAVLIPKRKVFLSYVLVLSVSLLLRYVPVLYTGNYFGQTPLIKELLTWVPIGLLSIFWLWKKLLIPKFSR